MIDSVQGILLPVSRAVMATKTELDDEAERVAILRLAEGHDTDAAFAGALGVSTQRLNNVLKGSPLGKDLAIIMCQKVRGLSLDWLYRGRTEGLTVDLLHRIEAAEAARKGTTPSRKGKEGR